MFDQQRFAGVTRVYGVTVADYLQQAHVCIAGLGGVGSWAVEALVRSGVGELTLIDFDDIAYSNTNRQLHALGDNYGLMKAAVMRDRMLLINPQCRITTLETYLKSDNISEFIDSRFDYVIDAIDFIPAKAGLVAHCKRNKIPVVMAGGAGGKTDPTKIEIRDLNKVYNDPLAAKARSFLRRHHNYSRNPKRYYGIPCVFSTQQARYPVEAGGDVSQKKNLSLRNPSEGNKGYGTTVIVTSSFGLAAASKVVEGLGKRALA